MKEIVMKGRGQTQKGIMVELRAVPNVNAKRLTMMVYKTRGSDPTSSQLSAVYKALRALEKKGVIKRSPVATIDGDEGWVLAVEPVQLVPLKGKAKAVK